MCSIWSLYSLSSTYSKNTFLYLFLLILKLLIFPDVIMVINGEQ